jgi:hypothetical protein
VAQSSATASTPAADPPAAKSAPKGITAPNPTLQPAQNAGAATKQMHQGYYDVGGRKVPLPDGKFEMLSTIRVRVGNADGYQVALARIEDNRLLALVFIFTTPADVKIGTGFRVDPDCERTDLAFKDVPVNEDFGQQDCTTVNHVWPDAWRAPTVTGIYKAVATALDTKSVAIPSAMINAQLGRSNVDGFLRIRYYFNPEARGIQSRRVAHWRDSDWFEKYIGRDPKKLEYMDDARQWALEWRKYTRQSFDQTLTAAPPVALAAKLFAKR